MQRMFLFLLICSTAFSMEPTDNALDETLVDINHSSHEVALPSLRVLPNSEKCLFIDSRKPGEVLFSQVTAADLNVSQEFEDFFVV